MREKILFGELKPGTRLIQRQLADEFGTSNIPVIESIRRLERDGFVVSHPRWGAQVNEWTLDDIEANFRMREGLETTTCRLFAERASRAEKLALEEYNERYNQSARQREMKAAIAADIALHLYIVRCTKSDNLLHLAERTCVITATIRNHFFATENQIRAHLATLPGVHDSLVAALISEDAERAAQEGGSHVHNAMTKLLRHVHETQNA